MFINERGSLIDTKEIFVIDYFGIFFLTLLGYFAMNFFP